MILASSNHLPAGQKRLSDGQCYLLQFGLFGCVDMFSGYKVYNYLLQSCPVLCYTTITSDSESTSNEMK